MDFFELVKDGSPESVQTAINQGANVIARDYRGMTPLVWAAQLNKNPDVISTLLKAGADMHTSDMTGTTVLMWAAYLNPNPDVITTLLKAGADTKAKDSAGITAFDWAQHNEKLKGTTAYSELRAEGSLVAKDTERSLEMSLSKEASILVSEALGIIEAQVEITLEAVVIKSAGSDGMIMEAVRKLEAAHKLCPEDASVHYAYASSFHIAAQYESAKNMMQACVQSHPDFSLALLALQSWKDWKCPFTLPPWSCETRIVHPAISNTTLACILLSVRDGLFPRATLFLRDSAGDFQDLKALKSAKITLATVISPVRNPQVIGVYAKIYDNASSPYDVEWLEIPFRPRGHPTRSRFEYLCIQEDIDFVVIDRQDRILLNKRLPIPTLMRETNREVLKRLSSSEGHDISNAELGQAILNHQRQFRPSDVRY